MSDAAERPQIPVSKEAQRQPNDPRVTVCVNGGPVEIMTTREEGALRALPDEYVVRRISDLPKAPRAIPLSNILKGPIQDSPEHLGVAESARDYD